LKVLAIGYFCIAMFVGVIPHGIQVPVEKSTISVLNLGRVRLDVTDFGADLRC
jgi:hypothetical protein